VYRFVSAFTREAKPLYSKENNHASLFPIEMLFLGGTIFFQYKVENKPLGSKHYMIIS
jgi:hypothetical protein